MRTVGRSTKQVVARVMRSAGYELKRIGPGDRQAEQFRVEARQIMERHRAQTLETVEALRERYREPVFGVVPVWSVVEMLSHVVDRVDPDLMNVSQEIHVLQLLERMIDENVDESLLLAAILHDIGKVLDLVGEDPANVGGGNEPIGEYEPGVGLDRCVFQWNHNEFGYSRFEGRVPDHVAWLIRYHASVPDSCLHLMDDRDRDYYARYYVDFDRWERETKSLYRAPKTKVADYRDLIDAAFPDPIPF